MAALHRVRNKLFSTQECRRRGRTRALLMRRGELCNSRRVGVDRGVAVEGPGSLALSKPVDTGENIPRVDAEPGASALDRILSEPRGVAKCEVAAAESDGGLLANTRNSTQFSSSSSPRLRRLKAVQPPPLCDASSSCSRATSSSL